VSPKGSGEPKFRYVGEESAAEKIPETKAEQNEIKILLAIRDGCCQRKSICQKTGVSEQRFNDGVNSLIKKGLIRRIGAHKDTVYQLTEAGKEAAAEYAEQPSGGQADGPIATIVKSIISPSETAKTDGSDG